MNHRSSKRRLRAVREFEPDVVEIEKRPLPKGIRWVFYTALLFLVVAGFWLYLAQVDIVVRAPGKTVSILKKITLGPMQRSVIHSIDVRVGQRVKKGQKLAVLDPTITTAELRSLLDRRQGLSWERKRLVAELRGENLRSDDSIYAELQKGILKQRRQEYTKKIASFDAQLEYIKNEIARLKKQVAGYKKVLDVVRQLERIQETLFKKDIASRAKYLDTVRARMEVEISLSNIMQKIKSLKSKMGEKETEKEVFMKKWKGDLYKRIFDIGMRLKRVNETIKKARHVQALEILRAPEDAYVLKIADKDRGSIIRSGEPLLILAPVPSVEDLEVRAEIFARDRPYIREGDLVKIKFDAFPFQKYGYARGRVRSISKDSFVKKNGDLVYEVRVSSIDLSGLHGIPRDFSVVPGMRVIAEIVSGKRRLYEYLVYPFIGYVKASFSEP